ncbi:MAG: nuclear transport factor 2 family protein [Pseudomonadota bacterium]
MLDTTAEAAVRAAAEGYCVALHTADADFLQNLCHDRFFMTSVQPTGTELFFDKSSFVARARARDPFEGDPSFEILSIDVEPEMAHVKLWVDMAPRRYCDYLGFMPVNGEWKLVTKLFRTASGPGVEA